MSVLVQDVSGALVTKFNGMSGLHAVYDYKPGTVPDGKYPYACVTLADFSGEFADTIRNKRNFVFSVEVYQERTEAGAGNQKAERIMRELVDEVLTAFDADTTLSGMVKWVKPVSGRFDYDDNETGDQRIAEFTLEAMAIVPSVT